MLDLIKRHSALYLVETLGFCLMGNHIHILIKTIPERFKHLFHSKHEKKPKLIKGLEGMYSLKRLSEIV